METQHFLKIIGDFEISNYELPNYIRPVRVGVCNQLREYFKNNPFPYRDRNFTVNGEELKWYGDRICTKDGKFAAFLKEENNDESSAGDLLSVDLPKLTMASYRNAIASFGVNDDPTKWLPETIIFPIQKEVWSPYHKRNNHFSYEDGGNVHGVINPLLYSIKPKKSPYIIIKGDNDRGSTEGLLLWYGSKMDNALYIELRPLIPIESCADPYLSYSMNLVLYRKKDEKWRMSKTFIDFAERSKFPLGGENTFLNKKEIGAFFAYDLHHIKSAITDLGEDFLVCKFITWLVNKLSQPSWGYVDIYKELEIFLNYIYGEEKIFVGTFCEVLKLLFSSKAVFNRPTYTVKFDGYVPVRKELAEERDIDIISRNPYEWAHKDGKIPITFGPVQISEICKRHEGLSEKLFLEGFVQKDTDYCVNVLGKPTILNFKEVMKRTVSKNPTVKDLEDGNFYVTEDITPEGIDKKKLSVMTHYLVKDGSSGKGHLDFGGDGNPGENKYFYSLPKDLFDKVISVIKTEEIEREKYLLKKKLYDKKDYVTFLKEIVWCTDDMSEIEDYNSPYTLGESGFDDDCNVAGYNISMWGLFLELFPKSLHEFFVDKDSSSEVKSLIKELIPYESKYDPELDFRFVDPTEIPSEVTLSDPEDWKKIQKPEGVSIKVEFVLS
jgi:hypothetical protein